MTREGDVIWLPDADARSHCLLGRYLDWLAARGHAFDTYDELWQWSVTDTRGFWRSLWDYFEIHSATPVGDVLGRDVMPGAEWFPGTMVNYAGEIVARNAVRLDEIAVVGVSQTRPTIEMTFRELFDLAGRVRAGLQRLGVVRGDRVVAYLPNIPETVAAYLACASLGVVWASCATEFGPQAVIDRFAQLEPVVLLAVDGYRYGDKDVDVTDRVGMVRRGIGSLRHVVSLPYNGRTVPDSVSWAELTAQPGALDAVPVPFDHPLCVLFSSGTTGLPKAIVHGHGGITIEHLKNHVLSWDLGPGDRLMWFSTTAWMMWNALVSTLLTGASIVTLDGNPLFPDLSNQWRIAATTGATFMGLSPAFVMSCAKQDLRPTVEHDLSALRMLAAAGSPLPVEGFTYLDAQFGRQAPLSIGSGGTDLCTGIVQGYPLVPVYAGEMSARCLGVAVCAYDESGSPVVGELGELVITKPMPSMPLRFWGDDDFVRYRATYFEPYPGVFRFGDWIRFTERGSSVITGRSDATLNRGGVRIGTAEIYRVVELHPDVDDSLVVHLEDPNGGPGELLLFVVTARDIDDGIGRELASSLRNALSPRHVPDRITAVSAVPRNLTGKKLELPVKRILQGARPDTVVSREAMADPAALDQYLAFASARR